MQTPQTREDHHLISSTAKLVAHLRAGTDIPYSKEIDKICGAEATTEALFGKRESLVWMSAMLELRYKSLSELLSREMSKKGIKQVLELACGIQPRGLIFSSNPDVTYIETDLVDMANEKKRLVAGLDPEALNRANYKIEPLNVLDEESVLRTISEFDDGSIAILHEGLLPYLSVDEKHIAATHIHTALKEKGGVWITPDISNSNRMRQIIGLFPDSLEAIEKISTATGRQLRDNNIGDRETTLQFYRDIGFNITEYSQKEFVPNIGSMKDIGDESLRMSVNSILDESNIWVLEVKCSSKSI